MTTPSKVRVLRSFMPQIFVFALTAATPLLDGVMAYNIARQADTARFAATTGTITASEVVQYRDNDGDVFTGADIRYRYAVAGRTFEGDTQRYSTANFRTSERGWAERTVRKYPVGVSVPVYYDPADPAQSLLQPGFGGTELFLIMFMTLFNAVMVASWFIAGPLIWRRWRGLAPPLPSVLRGAKATRLPFAPHAGKLGALAGIGGGSAIALTLLAPDATLPDMQTAWAFVLGAGAILGAWMWVERRSGAFDLVIREATVTLPDRFLRWRRPTLARSAIAGVRARPGWFVFLPNRIEVLCSNGRHQRLAAWYDDDAAQALATHVAAQLGVSPASTI